LLVAAALVQWTPTALSAPSPEDDWGLEVRDSDADLVAQRFTKLRRNPFDAKQWKALQRAIGLRGIERRVSRALARRPDDVQMAILDARVKWALGDPAAAAARLAEVEPRAGRWERRAFAMRVDALEDARDYAGAVVATEKRAVESAGTARESLLERAYSLADRGHLRDDALRLARRLADLKPDSSAAWLRLARAASRAGEADEADRAYARAGEQARSSRRADVTAERARARLAADDASGAAELTWSLLEQPKRGSRDKREGWWTTLVDAHRRDGSAAVLAERLADWLQRPANSADDAAWRALARTQEASGSDPIPAWRAALRLRPKDTETRAALIDALEASGRTEQAVAVYRATPAWTSEEVQLGLELANRLAANGDREGAEAIAESIEAGAGRRAHALLLLLDFYNLNNEPAKALAVARRLVEARPRDADARVALGEQLYQMHQAERALAQWNMLPKLVRPKHKGYAQLAEILNEHGRQEDAFRAVGKALQLAPREPQYLRLLAVVREERRRPDKALEAWREVLEVAKGTKHELLRAEARTRIVEMLVAGDGHPHGELARARAKARQVLERGRPVEEAVEAGLFLAELYTRQENYRAAVEVHEAMRELQPGNPDRLAELASAQRRAGQAKAAAETLEQLLEADASRRAEVLAELSEIAFETGDPGKALEVASRAARAGGSSTEALVRLGELHERRGDIDEAARAYEQALALAPRDTRAHLRLAELELLRGKVDAAARAFRGILEAGGPPDLMREAGRRALDLAEATNTTAELVALAVERTRRDPDADEPREFVLTALERADPEGVERWLRQGTRHRDPSLVASLRRPLVASLSRGSVGARLRAAEHLGQLRLPETAVPLARMGALLAPPHDATRAVREAFLQARTAALKAAGELDDPDAIPLLAALVNATDQPLDTRLAAAWALARSSYAEGAAVLAPLIGRYGDPVMRALGCLAVARRPRNERSAEELRALSKAAHEASDEQVQHACRYAVASLTPDHRLGPLLRQLESSDPLLAGVAAWRLGRVSQDRLDRNIVEALFRRYLGPNGLPRDAAASALAGLLADDPQPRRALPMMPPAQRQHGWMTVLERWLKAQVAPAYEPIDARALLPYREGLATALRASNAGTRAERMASQEVLRACPGDQPAERLQAERWVCLSPLVRQTVVLSGDHVDK